jgi:hypothetical protein
MKRTFLLFLILLVGIIGCDNRKVRISEKTIKKLAAYNVNLPSPDIALILFVKSSDGGLCSLNINTLHNIYVQTYLKDNGGFEQFVSNALNQRLSIDSAILRKHGVFEFTIDKEVKDNYDNLAIAQFQGKYCGEISNNHFEIKVDYTHKEKLYSILYFFFINNYQVLFNDYVGKYIIIR